MQNNPVSCTQCLYCEAFVPLCCSFPSLRCNLFRGWRVKGGQLPGGCQAGRVWPWGKSALKENTDSGFSALGRMFKGNQGCINSFVCKSGEGIFRVAWQDAFCLLGCLSINCLCADRAQQSLATTSNFQSTVFLFFL